ncbi:MAG: hypothetical protein ACE5JN_03200 [Candidatus Methylomirabilia bacterium]
MKSSRIIVAVAILTTLSGCQFGQHTTVPDDLIGVWKTSAPKYADRFFEITKDTIIFGTGNGNTTVHPIWKIETARDSYDTLYTISYVALEGEVYNFSFYHALTGGGVIRFKNQKQMTWTKARR